VEDMIVRVNDQVITRSDYQRADQQLQAELRRANLSPETDPRMKDLLRDLIDQQLLLSKGKELGITGETELIKQLDEIRKQNHLESMEDLEKAAQSQGVSYEDFKQSQRTIIITQTVVREEVGRHIQLTQADATAYYNAHKAEFEQPESVRLSEILVATSETDDPAKVAAVPELAADADTAPDAVRLVKDHLYLWCPNGILKATFSKVDWDRKLGVVVTMRNWNTATKLAELARA